MIHPLGGFIRMLVDLGLSVQKVGGGGLLTGIRGSIDLTR
jgi:hypothetical protein